VAEDAYDRLISLPILHGMNNEDVEDVIGAVRKVIEPMGVGERTSASSANSD